MVLNFSPVQNKLITDKSNYIKNKQSESNNSIAFKGAASSVMSSETMSGFFSFLQSSPVIGPAFVDLISMVIPRTAIDYTRGEAAGIETFRREVSSTINAFFLPGLYALGMGWLINSFRSEKKKIPNIAIDNGSAEALKNAWKSSGGDTREYARKIFSGIKGQIRVSETPWSPFPHGSTDKYADRLAHAIDNLTGKALKEELKSIKSDAIKVLGAENNVKLFDSIDTKLTSLIDNATTMAQRVFKKNTVENLDELIERMKGLNSKKALLGLGIATGMAFSLQYINRFVTSLKTGTTAFVGLPDYENKAKEDSPGESKKTQDKKKGILGLLGAKMLSSAFVVYMVGISLADSLNPKTIAKFLTDKAKVLKALEFKGKLATMNQMKALYGATIIGRIFASSDGNELRETNIRDIFGYLNLLVIGGLISAGSAYGFAKGKGVNLSYLFNGKKLPKDAGAPGRLWHVLTKFSPKSHAEMNALDLPEKTRKIVKSISNKSSLLGITYSALALGLFTPWFNKYLTNKAVKEKEENFGFKGASEQEKPASFHQKNFRNNLRLVEQTLGSLDGSSENNSANAVSQEFLYKQFFAG